MNSNILKSLRDLAATGQSISDQLALEVLELPGEYLDELCEIVSARTLKKFDRQVSLCAIVNAKSAPCSEDCSFCAQSAHNNAPSCDDGTKLLGSDKILDARRTAIARGADRFSPVTTGYALGDDDLDELCKTISSAANDGQNCHWCASLGCLNKAQLQKLKSAGVSRYHHNIESARSFFPSVCTTHSFEKRIETICLAKSIGLEVCSGGIIGLGESHMQRVEMARILHEENVDSIALNFLLPAENTRLADKPTVLPDDIIKTIAMMRLVNPESEIRIAAGRSLLGNDQHKIFTCGATGMMIGDYLTMCGQNSINDAKILQKANRKSINAPIPQ